MTETSEAVRQYRIGEVANEVGVTVRTIRYYEELGLVACPDDRHKGAHRVYDEAEVDRLRELVRLRDLLGLSLEELTQLAEAAQAQRCLRARWDASRGDAERLRIIEAAIPHVERQLDLVHARQGSLSEFEGQLSDKLSRLRVAAAELGRQPTTA